MMIRIALPLLLLAATPLIASEPSVPTPMPAQSQEELVRVALETSAGRIVIAVDRGRAPLTSANFLAYVESGKLDGESFYRVMPYGQGGLVQGGIQSDARKLNDPIPHEPTDKTGLSHRRGTVSMASLGPGTARSDFFILTTDIPAFDATTADPGFAAFGRVVEGMEVVEAILAAPVSPTKGEGVMKGQFLEPSVTIRKAARIPD